MNVMYDCELFEWTVLRIAVIKMYINYALEIKLYIKNSFECLLVKSHVQISSISKYFKSRLYKQLKCS